MSALLVIAILVVLIVGHELGHFIVAKLSGVKVEEFGVGYPPRFFSFGKIGETEYTLNWLPFGGFVRLFGEDGDSKGKGSFASASHSKQALILIAGVSANVILGWLLFTGGFMLGMPTAVSENEVGSRLLVSAVLPNSPAEESGILVGDEILSVISEDGLGAQDLSPSTVSKFISEHGGEDVTLTYMREGKTAAVTLIPAHAVIEEESGRPALGIALIPISLKRLTFDAALIEGAKFTIRSLRTVSVGLYNIIKDAFSGGAKIENLVGPVGLVGIVKDATGQGLGQLLGLAGFISINLAIINLIPIPALDGGRLLFVGIEAISRRKVPHIAASILNTIGFVAIIVLMLVVTYNDILRIVS